METGGRSDRRGGEGTGGDDTEWNKVVQMRVFVESKDADAKEVDNLMLRRFLRARDLDIEKASTLFLKYLKWRREALPNGFISDTQVKNELSQGKVFMQGLDKMGQPIVVTFGGRHYYSKREMDEWKPLEIMQNYYPERLGKVFLVNVPYIFMKAWKIIYPFIDKRTKNKFVFLDDKNMRTTLLDHIDESQLPETYGGKLPLVSIGNSQSSS